MDWSNAEVQKAFLKSKLLKYRQKLCFLDDHEIEGDERGDEITGQERMLNDGDLQDLTTTPAPPAPQPEEYHQEHHDTTVAEDHSEQPSARRLRL